MDNKDGLEHLPVQEKKVELHASFSCPSCASGAEKYSELFDHGTCVNCGSPLEQFSATLTEKGESELKSSMLLLYSKEDVGQKAKEIAEELKQNGIRVVDVNDVIDGSQTSVVSGNLAFVMNSAAGVLVIPSEHLEDNPAIRTSLNNAIVEKIEKGRKVIPMFFEGNISAKVPFGLIDTVGVDWDGKAGQTHHSVEKPRALIYFQNMVRENSQK